MTWLFLKMITKILRNQNRRGMIKLHYDRYLYRDILISELHFHRHLVCMFYNKKNGSFAPIEYVITVQQVS